MELGGGLSMFRAGMAFAKLEFLFGEGDRGVVEMEASDEAIPSAGDFSLLYRAEDIHGCDCDPVSNAVHDHELAIGSIQLLEEDIVPVQVANQNQVL